jgi:hypothetical protein
VDACSGGDLNRCSRSRIVCSVLSWLVLPCAHVAADGVESVRLTIPDCAETSGAQIQKLVALELASRENIRLEESDVALQASLRCDGERAVISVYDPNRAEPLVLEMQLAQTRREARPRLLALAIAELIATSRLEHAPKPKPAPEQVEPPSEPPEEPARVFSVWVGGGVLSAYEPRSWVPTLAAGAVISLGSLALTAELGFDWSAATASEVIVRARAASLALAPSLLLVREPFEWSVGLGVRLGYASLQATSRSMELQAGSVSGAFFAPLAITTARWQFAPRWYVRASLELAYIATPVRGLDADREPLFELEKYRAAGVLGIGIDL